MITFRIDPQGPDHVCLICVTEEREFFIMAGIERTPNVYLKCVAYCECAVAGMDIAKPQSRCFQIIGDLAKDL